jgi:hypothetical protein
MVGKPVPVYEIGRPGWHAQAACFETGTLGFFPQDADSGVPEVNPRELGLQARRIEFICAQCPVVTQCFKASIERRDEFGYWGGVGPKARKRMLRDLRNKEITLEELVAALAFRGPQGLTDAYRDGR